MCTLKRWIFIPFGVEIQRWYCMGLCTDWIEAGQANNTEKNVMIFFSAMTIILDLKYNYCNRFVLKKEKSEEFFHAGAFNAIPTWLHRCCPRPGLPEALW